MRTCLWRSISIHGRIDVAGSIKRKWTEILSSYIGIGIPKTGRKFQVLQQIILQFQLTIEFAGIVPVVGIFQLGQWIDDLRKDVLACAVLPISIGHIVQYRHSRIKVQCIGDD